MDEGSDGIPAMVRLSGTLTCITSAECDVVKAYLPEHIQLTRSEPGCLSFEVVQSDDPMIWTVEERFVDRASFEAHQVRAKASAWGVATKAIRRDYRITAADR